MTIDHELSLQHVIAERDALRAQLYSAKKEVRKLHWELGTNGDEPMATPEVQSATETEPAEIAGRMERWSQLLPGGMDPLDEIERLHSRLAELLKQWSTVSVECSALRTRLAAASLSAPKPEEGMP